MNGERCRDVNLLFELSMTHAAGAPMIAIIEHTTIRLFTIWQNEAKMINLFKGPAMKAGSSPLITSVYRLM